MALQRQFRINIVYISSNSSAERTAFIRDLLKWVRIFYFQLTINRCLLPYTIP